MSGAAVCWICLDGGADDTGMPLVRDCACRGDDAGFAHLSCIIKYAQKKSEQAIVPNEFITPWEKCPNCLRSYQNDLAVHIADAFVSFAKKSYDYPGNQLFDKVKVMVALHNQIGSNLTATSGRETMDAKDKIENLIHNLLVTVDQAKEEHDMGGWVHMAPTTDQFQMYKYICTNFEAFAYHNLAQIFGLDQTEEGAKTQIGYYSKARAIYDAFGKEAESKLMTKSIHRIRAESGGDEGRNLKVLKNIYQSRLECAGQNAEDTILTGFNYAICLIQAYHTIEAERLLTKLVAISRQVYGEDHRCTRKTAPLLKKCKRRLVGLADPDSKGSFQALRYENGGEICVVTGPIDDDDDKDENEGQMFPVASAMMLLLPGCPVMCYGLINAFHLNGKLGEIRSFAKDSSGGIRFGVHFEEKGLKSAAVKPQNLRIAFELPMRDIDETSTSSG